MYMAHNSLTPDGNGFARYILSGRIPLLMFSCFILLAVAQPGEAFSREMKHVLVLHSYHKGLTWTDNEDSGIRSVFQKRAADIELHTEYLDFKTAADDEHRQRLFRLLRHKYAAQRFKAVIATDDDAYNFYLQHRKTLFPGVPLFFCGVNYFEEAQRKGLEDTVTGVIEAFDVPQTLKTILQLHPQTSRLIVINDNSTTGQANKKILFDVLPEFEKKIKVDYFEELSMEELREKVGTLAGGDIILLLTFNRDRAGKVFNYDQSIALISEAAMVPIYGVWDFYLGKGIVGGMLTSGVDQGRTAAEMTLAFLDGNRIKDLPVVKVSPNRFMFDYLQLSRFGLDVSDLPAGSLVLNQPVSFYATHKELVWSAIVIFVSMIAVIRLLLINLKQRQRSEKALRESEERFRSLVEQSPVGIVMVRDLTILYANSKYAEIHGYQSADEVMVLNLKNMVASESWEYFVELVVKHLADPENDVVFEGLGVRKDGSEFFGMVTASRIQLEDGPASIAFVQDISKRKQDEFEISRLNEELLRNEKLAILGQLSGSVSHELRNPLGVINNAVYLLKIMLKDADEITREYLDIIKEEVNNSQRIVTDLLDFARRKPPHPKAVEIRDLINSSLKKCVIPHHVEVRAAFTDALPMLRVDRQQLEQVLQNLIINGIQAMPGGGTLSVTVQRSRGYQAVKHEAEIFDNGLAADFIEICISDNGEGIAPENMGKLFQPLFTTKPKGIGLGLVVCKNLVEANKGVIRVESEPGAGTTFTVILPIA